MTINLFETVRGLGTPMPASVMQIGASHGQEMRMFLENGIRSGIFVEPLTAPFNDLAGTCKQLPGFVAVNALCSDTAGETFDFHVATNSGMSSSILKPTGHIDMFGHVQFNETTRLTSTTVDDIMTFLSGNGHEAVTRQIDTLYMDAQGAEYRILLGSIKTLKQINYIYTELLRGDLYEGMQPLSVYCSFLETQGFTLNNINYNARHHADALFVRKSIVGLK